MGKKTGMFSDGFKEWLKFIWKAHLTNPLWKSNAERRFIREKAYMEAKSKRLSKYLPYIERMQSLVNDDTTPKEEKVYSLWIQGEEKAPEIVKKCISSMRRQFGDSFVLLDEKNLGRYITLPDFIQKKWEDGVLSGAHYSDIIRVELLYRHGGFWFDATDFVTGPIPKEIEGTSFFMYHTSMTLNPHMFIQNCFIHSRKGNMLAGLWRDLMFEYWKNENDVPFYFLHQILFKLLVNNNPLARTEYEKMPRINMDPTHKLWHKIGDLPFDKIRYEEMCRNAFFQKTSYKKMKRSLNEIRPGTMADYVINTKV